MWTSVPQIAVFLTLISTSLGPISGTGTSSIQIPGSAFAFTKARIMLDMKNLRLPLSGNHAKFPANLDEGGDRPIDIGRRMRGRHLRADARLALRHDGEREAD